MSNIPIKFIREDGKRLDLGYPWGIDRNSLEGLDWPDVSSETEPFAFQDGSFWRKNQATKRVISFDAICREADKNFAIRDQIGSFFNFSSYYEMVIDFDGKDAYTKGKITDFSINNANHNGIVRFSVELTSVNPFLQSASDFGRNLNEVYAKIHYPHHYTVGEAVPYSVRAFAANVDIVNNGDVPTGFVATVLFNEDTSFFEIRNETTDKRISINRQFKAGDVLQIDTNDGVARLNGSKFYNGISIDSEFFPLTKGGNKIAYNAATGESTMDINIYYRSQRVVF